MSERHAALFDEHPHRERFRLEKDGSLAETILLPVHVQSYDWAFLAGRGESDVLARMLASEDLELAELQPGTGTNVGLFAIRYERSDVGPFREYYLVVAARDRALDARRPAPERLGCFVWDIQLDSDLAIRCGRQIWGHPKTPCVADVGWQGADFRFRFAETSGQIICHGKAAQAAEWAYSQQRLPPFFFVTPYALRRSWAEAINEGSFASRAFEPQSDEFFWNPETRMGSKLAQAAFHPVFWTLGRDVQAVALR